jgi:ABC-type transport system involved in cytochrome c biogenesis ATPase subunit
MRIKSIQSSSNFKNLELEKVPFTRRTLVHGPNNCGKTNLLLLLELAFKQKGEVPGRDQVTFPIEGYDEGRGMLRKKGQEVAEEASASIKIECFGPMYKIAFELALPGEASVSQDVDISFSFESFPPGTVTSVKQIKFKNKVVHSASNPAKGSLLQALHDWVSKELAGAVVYVPNSRIRDGKPVPLNHHATLDPLNHLENTAFKFKNDPAINPRISEDLAVQLNEFFGIPDFRSELSMISQEDELGLGGEGRSEPHVGIGLQNGSKEWFPMSQVGTGIQQVFSILSQILVHPNASVALVEEFETSLSHPSKNRMLQLFLELTHQTTGALHQIVATSHNTFKPAMPEYTSIGAQRGIDGQAIGFKEWTREDWETFERS